MATKQNLISRLSQIVTIFQQKGAVGLTFEELNEKLKGSSVDDNQSISLRTFQRDIKDIESSLKIKIDYNKSLKRYVLEQGNTTDGFKNSQLFTLESINQLNIAHDVSSNNFILIDERTSLGLEYYNTIKEAILKKCYLEFDYQKFDQYKATARKIMPFALKENRGRWYVVGYELKDGLKIDVLKTFALDRMYEAQKGKEFQLKDIPNVKVYFNDYIGIASHNLLAAKEAADIKIETTIEYGKYFSTMPIHHSQEIFIEKGKSFIHLKIIPTMEFLALILSHNTKIKVVEPKELVQVIKKHLTENLKQYS